MNIIESIKHLNKLEKIIWIVSLSTLLISFLIFKTNNYLTIITSLIGATALIFVGKGDPIGQLLTIIFSLLYSIISFECHYYGEMITYAGMTLPSAYIAMICWLKHPYTKREVKVSTLTIKNIILLLLSSIFVTIIFAYILIYFNTAHIYFSIISVTTSYLASMLTILRNPYYAIAYSFNDIILIILWILATISNINYLPMVINFIIFLINDLYGFIRWQKMKDRQI